MRRWLFCILGVLLIQFTFGQGNIIWPESSTDIVTGSNATIGIQVSVFENITVEGYDVVPVGAQIGVFYSDGVNNYTCGGFEQWTGESIAIAAHGDDPFTNITDGFVSGQPYTWFLRVNNSEDPLDGWTDYMGENIVMDDLFEENWYDNALSNLLSINFFLYAEWTNCMDITACNYNQAAITSISDECEYPANEW